MPNDIEISGTLITDISDSLPIFYISKKNLKIALHSIKLLHLEISLMKKKYF